MMSRRARTMATIGYQNPGCPECRSGVIFQRVESVEVERVTALDLNGDVFDTRSEHIIESDRVGQYWCGEGHYFDAPIVLDEEGGS